MRTLVVGDIHGELEKLIQVLSWANFDPVEDLLISIGDIVDRGPDPIGCIEYLICLPNFIWIEGNHDMEFKHYLKTGEVTLLKHGAMTTISQWRSLSDKFKERYSIALATTVPYYVDKTSNTVFVHGGFDPDMKIENQSAFVMAWDRSLFERAFRMKDGPEKVKTEDGFDRIVVGHSPTTRFGSTVPLLCAGVWNVDTGSGKGHKLSVLDIEKEEYFQSD